MLTLVDEPSGPGEDKRLGRTELGAFRLVRALGHGRWATAYLAHDAAVNRNVVVKIARRRPSGHVLAALTRRFLEDSGRVRHPSLPKVLTAGTSSDGMPAAAVEYVEGEPLDQLIGRRGGRVDARLCDVLLQVAEALAALHRHGVRHGGVEAHNVLVVDDPSRRPRAYLTDVGLAALLGYQATGQAEPGDTHAAPEEFVGRRVPAGDMFRFGAIVWRALVGSDYRNEILSVEDLTHARLSGAGSNDPRVFRPELPGLTAGVLAGLMALDETDRMTADAFISRWPAVVSELRTAGPGLFARNISVPSVGSAATPVPRRRQATRADETLPPARPVDPGESAKMRRLSVGLVDANPITRHLAQGFLRRQLCDVRVLTREDLLSAGGRGIDLVVVACDGQSLGVISELRRRAPQLPAVVTSCGALPARCEELGADAAFDLPSRFPEFEAFLDQLRARQESPTDAERHGTPVLDPAAREHLLAEDPTVVSEMIEMFVGAVPDLLAQISESAAAADLTATRSACRTLQTNARALGASQLARLALATSELVGEGEMSIVPGFVSEMEREFGNVFRELMTLHAHLRSRTHR
mgnify:CR=1 FL=1